MITLTDVAYVRSGAADLDAATRFATEIVGLELVAPSNSKVAYLRADHRHHCLALVQGPSGVIASGFTVADSDVLEDAETELERSGLTVHRGSAAEARSRRVREFIAFDDPFGNRIELVSQQETVGRPVAFSRAAGITEFGHLCLDAPDVHEAYRFWSTRFNARVSDWIGDAACLMRIDPVHHKLAVFRGDEPGLCHMNFQVATIDDLFRNWHFLSSNNVEIEMGPGRHPQSTAIFLYFLGPEGFTYEYSFGVRQITDDAAWVPRTFDPAEPGSIDMWLGPTARPITQAQVRQHAGRVGGQGDGRADLPQLGGLLQDLGGDAALAQQQGQGQPAHPSSDDHHRRRTGHRVSSRRGHAGSVRLCIVTGTGSGRPTAGLPLTYQRRDGMGSGWSSESSVRSR